MGRTIQSEIENRTIGNRKSEIGQSEIEQSQITFDVSNIPTGIYFIRITTADGVVVKKVIKK